MPHLADVVPLIDSAFDTRRTLSTDDVAPAQRNAYWQDFVARCLLELRIKSVMDASFRATVKTQELGAVTLIDSRSTAQTGERTARMARQASQDSCFVLMSASGMTHFRHLGSEYTLRPGEMTLIDSTRSFEYELPNGGTNLLLSMARKEMEDRTSGMDSLIGTRLPLQGPLAEIAWSYLQGLFRSAHRLNLSAHRWLGAQTLDFIAGLLREASAARPPFANRQAAAPETVRRAIAYMEQNLAEPLRLAHVALHAGVGLRSLESAFREHVGVSPGTWLRNRRLDGVRAALESAAPGSATVTEVAHAWGFNHLGEFAGHYRARFGVLPSETLGGK